MSAEAAGGGVIGGVRTRLRDRGRRAVGRRKLHYCCCCCCGSSLARSAKAGGRGGSAGGFASARSSTFAGVGVGGGGWRGAWAAGENFGGVGTSRQERAVRGVKVLPQAEPGML
uniref:Uncharacterized protein n=1 Tax=Emiliania huxleyi TaxID=2903 RepID=A0A7S3WTI2_EMIHU